MKKFAVFSVFLFALCTFLCFASCSKDDGKGEPGTMSRVYRTSKHVIDINADMGVIDGRQTWTLYSCTYIDVIEIKSSTSLYKYQVHDPNCVKEHTKYQSNIYGVESDWNFFNDYWQYNRKDLEEFTFTYDGKRLTLSNGEVYRMGIDDNNYVINLVEENKGSTYVAWTKENDIKP